MRVKDEAGGWCCWIIPFHHQADQRGRVLGGELPWEERGGREGREGDRT